MTRISNKFRYEVPEQPDTPGRVLLESNNGDFSYSGTYDGDTIYMKSDHPVFEQIERNSNDSFLFRFAGINSSEVSENEPLSDEAKEFTKSLLNNSKDIKILVRVHTENENLADLDSFNTRPIGVIFVKGQDDKWINLNRSLLMNWYATPYYIRDMHADNEEKMNYELDYLAGIVESDRSQNMSKPDQREDYLGSFDPTKEVRVGDVQMPIPPESISVTTINKTAQSTSQVIRNQTTLTQTSGHNIKQIRMDFYINGLNQINGRKKKAKDISGNNIEIVKNALDRVKAKEIDEEVPEKNTTNPTYYINGLRALLAQFKLTPFLPIENYTVNTENDINAITLQNISVSNVKNFPNTLRVSLVCMEFNHHAYIDTVKPFKDVFNWDLFRFYYQRLLEGTNMNYNAAKKFPIVNDLDSTPFSFDVVDKVSLQKQEEAIDYLDDIPKNLKSVIKNKSDDSSTTTSIHDAWVIEDAINQQNTYNEELNKFLSDNNADSINDYILNDSGIGTYSKPKLMQLFEEVNDKYYSRIDKKVEEENLNTDGYYFEISRNTSDFLISKYGFNPKNQNYFKIPIRNKSNLTFIEQEIRKYLDSFGEIEENNQSQMFIKESIDDIDTSKDENEVIINKEILNRIRYEIVNDGNEKVEKRKEAEKVVHEGENIYEWNNISFDNVSVQNIGVSMSNKVKPVNLNMQTKPAHQYLGSKNITISIDFITQNSSDVQKINSLVDHVKEMELRFGEIIETPLLKINNSLIDVFGLDGVFIRDLTVNTIPNYPNGRIVQLSLLGYYKPTENFESLSRIYKSEADDVLDFRYDLDKEGDDKDIENYFAIKERLAKVNLYPDLELPKYCELPTNVPFLYQEFNDKYVDPDFYALNIDRMFVEEVYKVLDIDEYPNADRSIRASDSLGDHISANIDEEGIANANFTDKYNIEQFNVQDFIDEESEWPSVYFEKEEFEKSSSLWPIEMTNRFRLLLKGLDILRETIGEEIIITSAVRSEEKNNEIDGASKSKHLRDYYCAVDIYSKNYSSAELMKVVENLNIFTGRGLYPNSNSGFIHVDTRNGLNTEGNKSIVRWYRDNNGYHNANRDYDPDINGIFNGHLDGVVVKYKTSGDLNVYRNEDENTPLVISKMVENIYNSTNHASKDIVLSKSNKDRYHFSDIVEDIEHTDLDSLSSDRETEILSAVIMSKWKEEYRTYDDEDFIFTGDDIAFNYPEGSIDKYINFRMHMGLTKEEVVNHFLNPIFNVQALALAGYANNYFEKFYPIIKKETSYENVSSQKSWDDIGEIYDNKDKVVAVTKIMSYMQAYGITIKDMSVPNDNFNRFFEEFLKYYRKINNMGIISGGNVPFDESELVKLGDHIRDLARDILDKNKNVNFEDMAEVEKVYKGDNVLLRPPKERYKDSFQDMLKHDKRGRLVRAFPTYYLMLIDEGRDLWLWRLQDLFYEYSGVQSIDVVRSQENLADACYITLSNKSGHLSDATGGYKNVRVDTGFWETMTSVLPFDDFNLERAKRANEYESVQLQTGARIHLRMGYGSNPLGIPTMFNGTITELTLGDQIKFVAQNDGIELNRPIDVGPKETTNKEGIGVTEEPKEIITEILGDRGGIWGTFWRTMSEVASDDDKPFLYEDNVHGLRHLGALAIPDFWESKAISDRHTKSDDPGDDVRNFEIAQNIYDSNRENDENEHVEFAMFLYGKTPWDAIQTCAMTTPNYISYVHPFGIGRNTIFFGHPTFDLAYDYSKDGDSFDTENTVKEDIKTFRQMHVYGSFYDIISNNIQASSRNMYTAVKPVMGDKDGDLNKLDTLYLDTDIYPEFQKQVTIDTSIKVPGLWRSLGQNLHVPGLDEEYEKNAARRYGASALKQHVNTMYDGSLLVMGDPTVKPYDYAYMYDMEEQMNGMFEVNTVVHSMSKKSGFVSSINPNPISVINKGIKRDIEYFMWANSSMGSIYRQFFTTRAAVAALARSSAIGNANLTSLVQKVALGAGGRIAQAGKSYAKNINSATGSILNVLADFQNKSLNPTPWKNFKAKQWGGRIESIRDGISDSIKYTRKYVDDVNELRKYYAAGKNMDIANDFVLANTSVLNSSSMAKKALGYAFKYGDDIATLLSGPVGIAAKMYIEHVIFSSIGDFLRRKRDNREVITMMLLNRGGEDFSAGINGHKGAVFGDEPGELDSLFNNDMVNFLLGVDEDLAAKTEAEKEFAEREETLEQNTRDSMQNAYTSQYVDNYNILYDYDKTIEYYKEEIKKKYNSQESEMNSTPNSSEEDNNLPISIGFIPNDKSRREWINTAKSVVKNNRNLKEYPQEGGMKLHEDLITKIDFIKAPNAIVKNKINYNLSKDNDKYKDIYSSGLGVTLKADSNSNAQRIANRAIMCGIKSVDIDDKSVHIDLGPYNFSNNNSEIKIDRETLEDSQG